MPALTLKMKLLTPLLMNGGNYYLDDRDRPQSVPEIRAASFRGVMRFWLRTVLGRRYSDDTLRTQEARYFGSTENGSALRVQVRHSLSAKNKNARGGDPPYLMHKVVPNDFLFAGYKELQPLELILDTHPLRSAEEVFTSELYATLLLAFYLGAFGKRSRRGGGAFAITEMQPTFDLPDDFTNVLKALQNESPQQALKQCVDYVERNIPYTVPQTSIPQYPIFDRSNCVVLVGSQPSTRGYFDALNDLWQKSKDFHHIKTQRKMFNKKTKKLGQRDLDRWWAWGVAGLHLHPTDSERYNHRDWKPDERSEKLYDNDGRRASAVHLRVHHYDGQYYPLVTIFRALPDYDNEHLGEPESWKLLAKFINELVAAGYQHVFGDWSKW